MERVRSPTEPPDDESRHWMVVGAYLGGASVGEIANMCNLTETNVRSIIKNFKNTGSPQLPRIVTRKERSKLIAVYNEDGVLVVDSDDEKEAVKKIRGRAPTVDNMIDYVLHKAQKLQGTATPATSLNRHFHQQEFNQVREDSLYQSPPLSEPSSAHSEQSQFWTVDEDMEMIDFIFTRNNGPHFDILSKKYNGKHSEDDCRARWIILKSIFICIMSKYSTRGWF